MNPDHNKQKPARAGFVPAPTIRMAKPEDFPLPPQAPSREMRRLMASNEAARLGDPVAEADRNPMQAIANIHALQNPRSPHNDAAAFPGRLPQLGGPREAM